MAEEHSRFYYSTKHQIKKRKLVTKKAKRKLKRKKYL